MAGAFAAGAEGAGQATFAGGRYVFDSALNALTGSAPELSAFTFVGEFTLRCGSSPEACVVGRSASAGRLTSGR